MKCIDEMKCSAVVYMARGRAGRTGTEMPTEMLEWPTDRRDLSLLVKKITDIPFRIEGCFAGGRVMAAVEANARKRKFTMPRVPYKYPINPGRHEKPILLRTDCVYCI